MRSYCKLLVFCAEVSHILKFQKGTIIRQVLIGSILHNKVTHNQTGSKYPKVLLSTGSPKTINFPFVPNGKLMVLDVPIF